ncbi:transposase [Actinacidiphila glaucinigra]|uniref:transposase n=1 Tax=Actinacidiphila glaucinigra TaxID=235986 RepID=UPI00386365B4
MLLLADAAFDGNEFLHAVHQSGARFLVRSGARRVPTSAEHLGDGSSIARIGYGVLRVLLPVRVIEATLTVTLVDGTVRTERWRLITNLLDPVKYPATELVDLYHRRWQAETAYLSNRPRCSTAVSCAPAASTALTRGSTPCSPPTRPWSAPATTP